MNNYPGVPQAPDSVNKNQTEPGKMPAPKPEISTASPSVEPAVQAQPLTPTEEVKESPPGPQPLIIPGQEINLGQTNEIKPEDTPAEENVQRVEAAVADQKDLSMEELGALGDIYNQNPPKQN